MTYGHLGRLFWLKKNFWLWSPDYSDSHCPLGKYKFFYVLFINLYIYFIIYLTLHCYFYLISIIFKSFPRASIVKNRYFHARVHSPNLLSNRFCQTPNLTFGVWDFRPEASDYFSPLSVNEISAVSKAWVLKSKIN